MLVFSTGIISLGGLKGSVMRRGIHVFKVTGKFIIRYTTVGVDRAKILPVQVEPIQVVPIGKLGKKLILIHKKFKLFFDLAKLIFARSLQLLHCCDYSFPLKCQKIVDFCMNGWLAGEFVARKELWLDLPLIQRFITL